MHFESIDMCYAFLQSKALAGRCDIVEVFGGEGGCSKIAIRRQLTTGGNYDLTTGVDLCDAFQRKKLLQLIRLLAPLVVIMGPPCTAFSSWSRLNRVNHPEAHERSLKIGLALAHLAIEIANVQVSSHRHFLLENPARSQMWDIPATQRLMRHETCFSVVFDQCMIGLCDPDTGEPMMKPTRLLSSHPCLIKRFIPMSCNRQHSHQHIEGHTHFEGRSIKRSRFAQVWPHRMCSLIVEGILELRTRARRYYASLYPP
jgi:hypothetical protein